MEGKIAYPQKILNKIRGCDKVCGCGKLLIPVMENGKRIGVTHKTYEDDEYHMNFWARIKVEIIND